MPLPSDVDLKWLASERFKNTQLHGYDQVCGIFGHRLFESAHPPQITTVSQEAINRQIQLAHTDSAADSPLRQFSTTVSENDDWTYVVHLPCHKAVLTKQNSQIKDAKLDPSTVELLLGTDEKQTATIKDWRVVSKVRLNLLELDPEKVPKFVRDALTNPNDYSIRQLLVNFTTADISTYDPTLSVIDDDEAREDFHKHVKMYWDGLKKNDNGSHSTIHYLPTLKKPDTYLAPTIVPTSLNFQNFPFVLTGWNKGGEKNNDYNMLIYLQMTEKRDFPPDLLPAPKGSSPLPRDTTVPSASRNAFNKTTTWYSVIEDDSSKTPAPYNLDKGHFGPSGYENATDTPWTADTAGSNDTVLKYTYSRNEVMTTKGNEKIKFAQQKVNVWNHLEIPVGLDEKNESVIKTIDVLTWSAELVLKTEAHGAENGKLKIEVRNVKGDASIGEQGYSHASADVKRQLEGVLEALRAKIRKEGDALVNTMTHLKGDVDKLFGSSWSFIFGGNDDFWIDGAGFNGRVPSMIIMGCGLTSSMIYSEGDLLAQLIYRIKD
ncbi:hypothetical protein HWV62_10841 [Athelia sp. TMB]|nr:hypothetical protein HWV62_10841 [Athelia sp. TMB]